MTGPECNDDRNKNRNVNSSESSAELIDITAELLEEYEKLLLRRDQLKKEAGSIWTAYLREFGQEMVDSFKLKIACIRQKKILTSLMIFFNRGDKIDLDRIKREVAEAMKAYQKDLDNLSSDAARSLEAKVTTEYTLRQVKKLYRQIARMIHPDMHPEVETNDSLRELWERTNEAYAHNDLKGLEEILILVKKAIAGENITSVKLTPDQLREKIKKLEEEIKKIRTTDPYRLKDLLEDSQAVESKHKELREEIAEYTAYLSELKHTTDQLLRGQKVQNPGNLGGGS